MTSLEGYAIQTELDLGLAASAAVLVDINNARQEVDLFGDLGIDSDDGLQMLCSQSKLGAFHPHNSLLGQMAEGGTGADNLTSWHGLHSFHVEQHSSGQTEFVDHFRFVVDVYVVGVICLVGFVGNALTVAVLRLDPDKTNSTTWLLQALAAVDTLYLAACLVIQPLKAIHESTANGLLSPTLFPAVERHIWPFASVAQTATVWIVLLVTADRYVAVCRPFQARWRKIERTRAMVVAVCLLAVLYNVPLWFERVVIWDTNVCRQPIIKIQKTELLSNHAYFIVYKTGCHFVFRTVGPLLALSLLNWRLVQSLRAVRRRRKRIAVSSSQPPAAAAAAAAANAAVSPTVDAAMVRKCSSTTATANGGNTRSSGGGSRGRENVTMMVVAVICVFIVCELPDAALRVVGTIANDPTSFNEPTKVKNERAPMTGLQMDNATAKAVNSVTNALLALNSAANFAVYCLVGKKFRRILRRRLCVAACVCVNAPSTVENGESVCCYYCNRRTASGRDFDAVTALERNTCTRPDGYSMAAMRPGGVSIPPPLVEEPLAADADGLQLSAAMEPTGERQVCVVIENE